MFESSPLSLKRILHNSNQNLCEQILVCVRDNSSYKYMENVWAICAQYSGNFAQVTFADVRL